MSLPSAQLAVPIPGRLAGGAGVFCAKTSDQDFWSRLRDRIVL